MKIAVNTRLLLKDHMEGIGWYTHELMSRLVKEHPEHDFYFFFDRPYDDSFVYAGNVHPVVIPPPARHVFLISYWFDVAVRRMLLKLGADLFFSPDSINLKNPVCKTITTIHDLNFITHPENLGYWLRRFYRARTEIVAKNSNVILTVSDHSRDEISELLQVDKGKVEVIYNACRPGFRRISAAEKLMISAKYSGGKDYFLFIGGLYHRKNLVNLVKAYELFRKMDSSGTGLILVGRQVRDSRTLLQIVKSSDYRDDIILTGRINDENEIKMLMGGALALTYVSVAEGFGMPLVEAMQSGTPILTSSGGSMFEVAGDAAIYADPYSLKDIAEKMLSLRNDEGLRNKLSEAALIRAGKFDWSTSAHKLWTVMENLLKQR